VAVYDFYGPGKQISEKLGRNLEKLKQEYTVVTTTRILRKKGYKIQRQQKGSKILLTARR